MEKFTPFALLLPDGGEVSVKCYTIHKRDRFEHHAEGAGVHAVVTWGNRTWESFEYESVLRNWVKSYSKDPKTIACFTEQLKAIAQGERDRAEAWLKDFEQRWSKVDPDLKERTARALGDHVVASEEEAEAILKTAEIFTAMKKIGA